MLYVILFVLQLNYTFKIAFGYRWLKIFYHDSIGGVFFKNLDQTMNNLDPNLYSVLNIVNYRYKINHYYVFLLEYPDLAGSNHWKQSKIPWYNTEVNGSTAEGYTPINITWNTHHWGGLVKSNNYFSCLTLMDGSAGTNYWWYALGVVNSSQYYPKYPGPNGILVNKSALWIRIDDLSVLNPITLSSKRRVFPILSQIFLFLCD